MPEWMWIVISIGGFITLGVILWSVAARGITAKHGHTSIVINGRAQDPENPLNRALQHVQRSTPEVQHILFRVYLRLMKEGGADPDFLTDYDDSRFVRMLLRFLVNGGNGTRSVQKIIEEEIVYGEWKRRTDDIRAYVSEEVWPSILRAAKDLINQEYDTEVLESEGRRRQRIVSNTDFADALDTEKVRNAVVDAIVPMFSFAKRCLANGCEG